LKITARAGLVGFLLALSTLSISAAAAEPVVQPMPSTASVEDRLNRIAAAIRQRETQLQDPSLTLTDADRLMAYGFADGSKGGSFNQAYRGGTATTPAGGTFNNYHGGAAGWKDGWGFANGAYGGAAFKNGAYRGAGWRNVY
jgi:rSAM-associated Gly-rich repeat protein